MIAACHVMWKWLPLVFVMDEGMAAACLCDGILIWLHLVYVMGCWYGCSLYM